MLKNSLTESVKECDIEIIMIIQQAQRTCVEDGALWVACATAAAAGAGTLGLTNVISLNMHKLQTCPNGAFLNSLWL